MERIFSLSFFPSFFRLFPLFFLLLPLLFQGGCGGGECRHDADCEGAKFCKDGRCISNILTPSCTQDSDCKAGEKCIRDACIAAVCSEGETQNCYEGPIGTNNVGPCKGGQRKCTNGQWGWCEGQIQPARELCDGIDNNCNGLVDEDPQCNASCQDGQTRPCYTGPPGTQDIGTCRAGEQTCQSGVWGGCVGDIRPTPNEVCGDNLDNNCNGQIDEGCGGCQDGDTRPCYTGPANTRNTGTCKDGTQTCSGDQWGSCTGEVLPETDKCGDNLDNDCNGKIDDAPGCSQGCQDGDTRPCYTGSAGTKGVGICKEGAEPCIGDQWSGVCMNEVLPRGQEICGNNLDDNCNNQVDEGCGVCRDGDQDVCYTGTTGCTKQADGSYACNTPCRSGVRACQGGQWGACTGETKPQPQEICGNNVDDNCNGQIDEGCGVCTAGQTRPCYTGAAGTRGVGACRDGVENCTNGQWGTCTGDIRPQPEVCGDSIDNNCDGRVDEGCSSARLHQPCQTPADCDNGQLCINIGTAQAPNARCFQDCTSRGVICQQNSDGRTACVDFARDQNNTVIQICARQVGLNQSCNLATSTLCQNTLACINGTCIQPTIASEGGSCDTAANPPIFCPTNNLCVSFGAGFPNICLVTCNTTNPSSCRAGFACAPLSSGGSDGICIQRGCTSNATCTYPNHSCGNVEQDGFRYCYPNPLAGPIAFGRNCTPSDPTRRCQQGLTCLTFTGDTTGICSQLCNPGTCPATSRCVSIGGGNSACLVNCTSCQSNQTCVTSGSDPFCYPSSQNP